jgi:tripartite-type tricarboxylate transporter receptor subunit TctC
MNRLLSTLLSLSSLLVLAGLANPLCVNAQEYPNRPIRFVVPFPPGGATDVMARTLAARLHESLGQPVVVENRAGAAGAIGSEAVAKAPADGYTILLGTISTHGTGPAVNPKLPYDVNKDFTAISLLAHAPLVLLVHPEVPVQSLQDFFRLARSGQPPAYGSNGNGSYNHLAVELLKGLANVDLLHVPYKGAGPAIQDLMAGQIKFGAHDIAGVAPHIRSGKLKALAVASKQRVPGLDVPTTAESGIADFEVTAWYALFGPPGVPAPVLSRLHGAVAKGVASPEMQQVLNNMNAIPVGDTPAQLDAFVRSEVARWSSVAKKANIKLD